MIKLNMLRPICKKPTWTIWFKYEKPDSLINQLELDIKLITPRKDKYVAGFSSESGCLISHPGSSYVKLHGEIYRV